MSNFINIPNRIKKTLLLPNDIWLFWANPNNRYVIIMQRESMTSLLVVCCVFVFFRTAMRYNKTDSDGCYPSLLEIVFPWVGIRQCFPNFGETIPI